MAPRNKPLRNDAAGRKVVEDIFRTVLAEQNLTPAKEKCSEGVYVMAYEARDPFWVFVPDPIKRGRFCRVPRYFLFVGCPACGALAGQPCWNPRHGTSWSGSSGHADRRYTDTFPYRKAMPATHDQRDDRTLDAAVEGVLHLLHQPGVTLEVKHLDHCEMHTRKRGKKCTCGADDRAALVAKLMKALPKERKDGR